MPLGRRRRPPFAHRRPRLPAISEQLPLWAWTWQRTPVCQAARPAHAVGPGPEGRIRLAVGSPAIEGCSEPLTIHVRSHGCLTSASRLQPCTSMGGWARHRAHREAGAARLHWRQLPKPSHARLRWRPRQHLGPSRGSKGLLAGVVDDALTSSPEKPFGLLPLGIPCVPILPMSARRPIHCSRRPCSAVARAGGRLLATGSGGGLEHSGHASRRIRQSGLVEFK